MSDDLVERVARELRAFYSDEPVAVCDGVAFKAARAAIAVCMEEAADAVGEVGDHAEVGAYINAVRALIPK